MVTHRRTITAAAAVAVAGLAIGASTASAVVPVQTGPIGWTSQVGTSSGDYMARLAPAPSSGVYAGGGTEGNFPGQGPGDYSCLVSRFDKVGNALWHRQIPSNQFCDVTDLASSSNGDVVASIHADGTVGTTTDVAGTDGYVAKYDKNGNLKWLRQLGSVGDDALNGVALGAGGVVYVTGRVTATVAGLNPDGTDIVVAKYDKNGTLKWTKIFGTAGTEEGTAIAVGPNDDLYITGETDADFSGAGYLGASDGFILKLDKNGSEKARVRLASNDQDEPKDIAVTKKAGVRVVGGTYGQIGATAPAGDLDGFIAAFGLDLTPTWTTQIGTAAGDRFLGLTIAPTGETYAGGNTSGSLFGTNQGAGDAVVLKVDKNGVALWGRQFGTTAAEQAPGVVLRSSNANGGGLVLGLHVSSGAAVFGQTSAGDHDLVLIAIPK